MNHHKAIEIFEALASETRLNVYRLLVKYGHDGLVAGEISSILNIQPNNLSFHLKGMVHAGLILQEHEGRFLRYRANMDLMVKLIGYLTKECCAGRPEICNLPGTAC